LLSSEEERYGIEDYKGDVPRWCVGCGDNSILAAVQRLARAGFPTT
jgi:2-oxoglutarate ferredoxin oxidoreductase subunit beta